MHQLSTEIGRREQRLLKEPPSHVDPSEFEFASLREAAERNKMSRNQELDGVVNQLSGWYSLLAQTSNEVFIVEHCLRPRTGAACPA
jgi:hypothetical protein